MSFPKGQVCRGKGTVQSGSESWWGEQIKEGADGGVNERKG